MRKKIRRYYQHLAYIRKIVRSRRRPACVHKAYEFTKAYIQFSDGRTIELRGAPFSAKLDATPEIDYQWQPMSMPEITIEFDMPPFILAIPPGDPTQN